MSQILKSIQSIKASNLLAGSALMISSISTAQALAVSYNVTGVLFEPQTQSESQSGDTVFNGSFNWDGTTVSSLHGTMNSSMYLIDDINPDFARSFPLMHLDYQLAQSVDGNIVTATVFKENTTDVFTGGGYEKGAALRYGNSPAFGLPADGNTPNDNAYFTLFFDKTTMEGVVDSIVYADCTAGGMMGQACMTGHDLPGGGTMSAYPTSLTITELAPAPVPVPAAVWLFGSALIGMVGVSRKRNLPA